MKPECCQPRLRRRERQVPAKNGETNNPDVMKIASSVRLKGAIPPLGILSVGSSFPPIRALTSYPVSPWLSKNDDGR